MSPDISIIGTGALGTALARALIENGYVLKSLYNRTDSKAGKLGAQLHAGRTGAFPSSPDELGDLVFLTVTDDAIGDVARTLGETGQDFTGTTAVHCSGNLTSEILEPLREKGASVAAFHPIQTFAGASGPDVFEGIHISIEGDEEAAGLLREVAERLGAECLPIAKEAKPYLHAGAVMASNYLVTLLEAAVKIAEMGGVEPISAQRALMPLVRTALENASSSDLSDALSGPVARGDIRTVKMHLELLEQNPRLLALYKQHGLRAVGLARKKESAAGDALDRLERMFLN